MIKRRRHGKSKAQENIPGLPDPDPPAAQVESELKELESEEAAEFLASLGATESGLSSLVRTSYQQLGLRTYFTTGARRAIMELENPKRLATVHGEHSQHQCPVTGCTCRPC